MGPDIYLSLRTTPGRLQLSGGSVSLQVRQRPAELEIRSRPGGLALDNGMGQLQVDSTRPRAETGYLNWFAFVEDAYVTGEQAAVGGVARRVDFGQAYADVHANPAAIALAGTAPRGRRDWNIGHKPQSMPRLRFQSRELQISYQLRPPTVQFRAQPPIIEAEVDPLRISYKPQQLRIEARPRQGELGGLLDMSA